MRRSTPRSSGPTPGRRPLRRVAVAVGVVAALVVPALGTAGVAQAQPLAARPAPAPTQLADPGDGSLGLSAPFGSFAPVAGRPADPPIGVPFESLSRAGGTPITIDGQDVPNTTDGQNYSIAVVDRSTRAVVESGTVNRGASTTLGALADKYSGQGRYLMVVSSFRGIIADAGNTAAFQDAVRKLGGRDLTADEVTKLRAGSAFSVIGIPGGAAGGAYVSIDAGPGNGPHGNVNGYLRVNVATDQYGVVNPDSPTFDTTNTASDPARATALRFDHRTFTSETLPAGQSGFLVLSFDDGLQLAASRTIATNGTSQDARQQDYLAGALRAATGFRPTIAGETVVVRSIGRPTPVASGWSDAALEIEKLGGNRLAFTNLSATSSDYSLVGGRSAGTAAIEASGVLGSAGPISGSLARNRSMAFTPVAGAAGTGVNTDLVDIATQAPRSFPAFTTGAAGTTAAGTAAADAYLGRKLLVCASAAAQPTCSVRTAYYLDYGADWHQVATDLNSAPYATPPTDATGFTAADYQAVRTQLALEVGMVNRVRTYFAGLQKPFGEAAQAGALDTTAITNAVAASVGAPGGSASTSFALGLVSKIALLGTFAGPPVSAVSSGISAAFGLGAYLTRPTGTPQLATDVRTTADDLGRTVRAEMLATSRSINGTAMITISDYGRLTAVNTRLPTEGWRLPNDTGPTLATMTQAVQQSAAEKLVPLVFPWLIRGTPERSAQSMSCGFNVGPRKPLRQENVWGAQPADSALNVRDYITSDGRSIPAPYWFARAGVYREVTPPASLTSMLFAPADPAQGKLGMNLYAFLSPRVFGAPHQANDSAYLCNLPFSGPRAVGTPVDAAVGVPTLLSSTVAGRVSGTVTFTEDGTVLPGCADRPVLAGAALCVTTFTTAGEHDVAATYSGTDTETTVADVTVQVSATPTPLQRIYGQLVTFAARFHLFGL